MATKNRGLTHLEIRAHFVERLLEQKPLTAENAKERPQRSQRNSNCYH